MRRHAISFALSMALFACAEDRQEGLDPNNNNNNNVNNNGADSGPNMNMSEVDSGSVDLPDAGTSNEPDAGMLPPGRSDVQRMEVGTVMLEQSGDSAPISFTLPEGVTSFTVLISGDEANTYIIKKMTSPGGTLVSDDASMVTQIEAFLLGPFAAQFKSPNRVVQDKGVAAFLFPNNPAISVAAGEHVMTISGMRLSANQATPVSGEVTVEILYRTAVLERGRLDVSLYFSGAAELHAADAPTSTLIIGAIEKLREIYGRAGIEIGALAYYDIDESFRTITGIDGSGDQLEQMMKLSEGKGPGLHYFFVDRFEAGFLPGAQVAGVSGGLPGPPLRTGSVNSGVAVALAMTASDPNTLAHVMAHEGGHWLGLYHTSEIIGTEDQMPDTPSGEAGNTFLMYPAVGGGTEISASQATVMRNHAEVMTP
jgi:hypothetical protein